MRHGNLINASRSRAELTCEISNAATKSGQSCACFRTPIRARQKRSRHSFLPNDQVNEKEIKHTDLEAKIPGRASENQKEKEKKHARVCHQQTPRSQHRAGGITIKSPKRIRNSAAEATFGQVTQLPQPGREQFLLPCEI